MNDFTISNAIDEELLKELEEFSKLDPRSNEAKELMNIITTLHQMRMKEKDLCAKRDEIDADKYLDQQKLDLEERKIDNDRHSNQRKLDLEERKIDIDSHSDQRKLDLDEQKMVAEGKRELIKIRDARIFQIVGVGVTVGTFIVGWSFRSKWLAKGFKFEESGTFASKTMMECFKEIFKKN